MVHGFTPIPPLATLPLRGQVFPFYVSFNFLAGGEHKHRHRNKKRKRQTNRNRYRHRHRRRHRHTNTDTDTTQTQTQTRRRRHRHRHRNSAHTHTHTHTHTRTHEILSFWFLPKNKKFNNQYVCFCVYVHVPFLQLLFLLELLLAEPFKKETALFLHSP